jgi:AraC family transcriptional regulator
MDVKTETLPGLRLAALRHTGPYQRIGRAFGQLHDIITRAGLPHRELVALFHDDPRATPVDQLRSDAGTIVDEGVALPPGLTEQRIPAGRYATVEHRGSYAGLGDAWMRFTGDVEAATGQARAGGVRFERYCNTPMEVPEDQLRTQLYISVAAAGRAGAP